MTSITYKSENKRYYVGVDKHRWWKEATIYHVSYFAVSLRRAPLTPARYTQLRSWTQMVMDGATSLASQRNSTTSKTSALTSYGSLPVTINSAYSAFLHSDNVAVYKSPQADMGYDISDYKDIDPMYGTLADVDELIASLKARGMKLVMDLVANHTSDQHAWFLESRSSQTNPKRDWYIWKPPKYDENGERQPPNNWAQLLGEANSAWTWDEGSQEYYLSLFTPDQPDLNWENPDVREAIHEILHFWLKRGVSGFRMDVINLISKWQAFPDAPITIPSHKYQPGDQFFANGPRLHEYLKEITTKVLSQYDSMTVGEMPFVRNADEIIRIVGSNRGELNMIFAFDIVDIDNVPGDFKYTLHAWDAKDLKRIIARLQRLMIERDGWNSIFVENHDQPRSVSRYTDDSDEFRAFGAQLLCLMQISLSGTLFVYQGEELGMRNVPPSWDIKEYKDVESINFWAK